MILSINPGINWTAYNFDSIESAKEQANEWLKSGYRCERQETTVHKQNYQYYGAIDLTQPPHNYKA